MELIPLGSGTFGDLLRKFRHNKDDPWIVQRHPVKEAQENLSETAAHVLSSMMSILLARQDSQRMAKYINAITYTDARVKSGATLYTKADKNGDVAGTLPANAENFSIQYGTPGLNDDDTYWHSMYFEVGPPMVLIIGYIVSDVLRPPSG
jgi:hypothetical protein